MGVTKLWGIIEPFSVASRMDALTGQKLAIDASIWLHQFQKAMRDSSGEMIERAHLIGFLRRICKLLFHSTRPIFVFDGKTPELKRKTIIKRQNTRKIAAKKLEITAQKLFQKELLLGSLTGQEIQKRKPLEVDDDFNLPHEKKYLMYLN